MLKNSEIELAQDPDKLGLSHPCFMVIPVEALNGLSFSFGVVELGADTGRFISMQLLQNGHIPKIHKPMKSFNGIRGDLYSNGKIFHFGSGSFAFSKDSRLTNQIFSRVDKFFINRVKQDNFKLNKLEKLFFLFGIGLLNIKKLTNR